MFQFRPFPSYAYLIQRRITEYCSVGFPHSDIHGSMDICSSPWLFAACHVLLRLLMPRHSPCALSSLTCSSQAPYRSLPRVRDSSFTPLLLTFLANPLALGFARRRNAFLLSCVESLLEILVLFLNYAGNLFGRFSLSKLLPSPFTVCPQLKLFNLLLPCFHFLLFVQFSRYVSGFIETRMKYSIP